LTVTSTPGTRRRSGLFAGIGLLVLLVGCGAPAPSPASRTSSSSPSASGPTSTAEPSSPALQTGTIDQRFTTPALEYRSTGSYLIWSSGARASKGADVAPDLFGSTPGGSVSLLYDNPNRDSRLEFIGGDGTHLAFIEDNSRVFGRGGWKLWYLSGPGTQPTEIDHGLGGQLPFFAMSGHWLVWTAVHGQPAQSQLLLLDLTTMRRRVLLSASPARTQYWLPSIDGNRIVFGTVELAADGQSDQRHVYLLNVDTQSAPTRLDNSPSASEPVIHGDDVVWKESDPTLNFLNAGSLVRYSLTTKVTTPIKLPTVAGLGFTDPSIGNRFVAAWAQSLRDIYLLDLRDDTALKIIDLGPMTTDPTDGVARPDVAGDLLTYAYGPATGDLQLRWVILPH
jgi:hypothetical protein